MGSFVSRSLPHVENTSITRKPACPESPRGSEISLGEDSFHSCDAYQGMNASLEHARAVLEDTDEPAIWRIDDRDREIALLTMQATSGVMDRLNAALMKMEVVRRLLPTA